MLSFVLGAHRRKRLRRGPVASRIPLAQRYFHQGMALAWGFNPAEAANRDPAEAAALKADAERAQRLRATFRTLVAATRDRLAALYASTASDAENRAGKAEAFAAMRAGYERQNPGSSGVTAFDRWLAGGANNAGIAAAGLYADRVPQFTALLAAEDGDLVKFYARVRALAAMPPVEREAALAAAVARS